MLTADEKATRWGQKRDRVIFKVEVIGHLGKNTFGDIGRMPGGPEGKAVETVLHHINTYE